MLDYLVIAIALLGGLVAIMQGVQAVQGRRRLRQDPLSRILLSFISSEQQDSLMKIEGALRIAFGLFLFAIGVSLAWTLL